MFYDVTGRQFLGSGIHLEERAALHCISRLLGVLNVVTHDIKYRHPALNGAFACQDRLWLATRHQWLSRRKRGA